MNEFETKLIRTLEGIMEKLDGIEQSLDAILENMKSK